MLKREKRILPIIPEVAAFTKRFSVILPPVLSCEERTREAVINEFLELGSRNILEPVSVQTDANVKRTFAPLIVHYFAYLDQIFSEMMLMCIS